MQGEEAVALLRVFQADAVADREAGDQQQDLPAVSCRARSERKKWRGLD